MSGPSPPTVFISYSHADKVWKERLVKHLGVLQNQGLLQPWNDQDIGAGVEWLEEIRKAMGAAKVAVFLVSANSLTSKFILDQEIPRLLERRIGEGMTIFPVLCADCPWQTVSWLARLQIRPGGDKALEAFRTSRRNTELKKIALEIFDLLQTGAKPSPGSTPAGPRLATAPPSLHQLPAPPADFTGREKDLEVLRSALLQGPRTSFCVQGMGGIGKTALALKLADEQALLYPDAQLFLDLKGVDPQPLTTAQAMAHVVKSFHPDVELPESGADLAGLYQSVLHGKRVLLLMDNAGSREQVEPLIPSKDSLLLVTSRVRFTLPGQFSWNLGQLPAEDARNLLLKIAPRIGRDADAIARLCGRLPLALRLAGSTLAERPDLSPADYVRRLKEGKERLDPVEASLTVSYGLLPEERRRLWCLLAAFASTFDAPAAAAVWGLETDPALEALGSLVRSSLLEWEEKDGRYHLHDLARSFADRQLEGAEREAARRRHAEYFLELLRSADEAYAKGGESLGRALRIFDAEWDDIQAGFTWAAERFAEDETAARICADYPLAGAFLLELRQHPREQIRWRETALAAARRRKDRRTEGVHLGSLGNAYATLGDPRRAIKHYEQWLAIAREVGHRQDEGHALGNLGVAYADLGKTQRAIEYYEQQLAIARKIGDRRGKGKALGNLGLAYADLGDPELAISYFEKDLAIARKIGDRRGEGQSYGNLGLAYADLGKPRRAIKYHEKRLAIAREIGDRRGEAHASWNMGLVLEKEGKLARAADLMQVLVEYEREIGHPEAEEDAAAVAALRARIAEQAA